MSFPDALLFPGTHLCFLLFHSDTSLGMNFLLTFAADPCPPSLYFPHSIVEPHCRAGVIFGLLVCISDPLCGCSICSIQAGVESEAMAGNLVAHLQEILSDLPWGYAIHDPHKWSQAFHRPQFSPICLPTNQLGSSSLHRPQDWSTQSDSHQRIPRVDVCLCILSFSLDSSSRAQVLT